MNKKIYITGSGVVCAIGRDKQEVLRSLLAEKSGVAAMKYLQSEHKEFPVGEVKLTNEEMREALAIPMDTPETRTALMGIMALQETLRDARLGRQDRKNACFISGTTVGGMDMSEQYYLDFKQRDTRNEYIATHDCGACTEMIADYFGGFALVTSPSTACSSAANAVILGANLIKAGLADIVVAGGSECITKFHLNGFHSLMILDREPCRPFDKTRAGLNLGEGAAYVVLESEASVKSRGIAPQCLLSGYGNSCDAYHQTASSPNGDGSYLAMKSALEAAGMNPEDIGYINAHGTGTFNNDLSESKALARLFGSRIPPVSSTKPFTGHTTSASGSIELVVSMLAIQHEFMPANLNWKASDEGLVVPVTSTRKGTRLDHVLCNAFGFGGNDSSLIISKTVQ